MKKLSVIIVNYNTKDILRDCIKNLDGKYPNMELIVVDNNSSDGSAEMVKNDFIDEGHLWINLVESSNKGIAHGYNLGLKQADGDYILFLGSDAFPGESTLSEMIEWMEKSENDDVGIATSKLVQRDNSLDMDSHRGFPTPWAAACHFSKLNKIFPKSKIFNQYFLGWKDMEVPHEIDLCISHFMLVKREVFEKVGKWDEDFWVYGEDVDFCWRAKQAGFKIYYLPMWETLHYKGSSIGVRKGTRDVTTASYKDKYKSYRASVEVMRKFYEKHWQDRYPKILTGIIFFVMKLLGKYRLLKLRLEEK